MRLAMEHSCECGVQVHGMTQTRSPEEGSVFVYFYLSRSRSLFLWQFVSAPVAKCFFPGAIYKVV